MYVCMHEHVNIIWLIFFFFFFEDSLKQGIAIHSSIRALRIPWTEKPGKLHSKRSWRVRHDWALMHTQINITSRHSLLLFNVCWTPCQNSREMVMNKKRVILQLWKTLVTSRGEETHWVFTLATARSWGEQNQILGIQCERNAHESRKQKSS